MGVETQLSVFLENRPGILAHICDVLCENEINILALSTHDTVDNAVVRILCDNPTKALLLLEQEDLFVLEQKVVVLEIENRSGALSRISRQLARADINIGYAYCTATPGQESGCLVLKTDEPEKAWNCLQGLHF
ncbi:MAG: amino acid-binding protein [Candidatus Omnitrophica bacterium CG11_big_fil_rev_8_21_14_0_20_45_26]|uniref:Amino acid-binding protein n=1 Tax=Candidatus Abzuiibacterium crystallinum TaxID=1974748 RepID=A0A2H0LT72_9BACT|nr:MAG: amino acid-binding protein [Candidatus Omnitrophica bacterium CG11_big_fil_rev_8_21_14_0_20_45_26]PIW65730.1 MAG: amino acid-binding protein [Candidatus Omnitrophica bacterium CG12_big_fil_rev_8_21_14_0_65_45_16]